MTAIKDPNTTYITQQEKANLKAQLNHIKTDKLKELNEGWRLAVEEGDDRETDALSVAVTLLQNNEWDRIKTEKALKEYVVYTPNNKDIVDIGLTVTIKHMGKTDTYQITGPVLTNPIQGYISYKSPLGQTILHKREGDRVKHPVSKQEITILEIRGA